MASMIARIFDLGEVVYDGNFPDIDITNPHYKNVQLLKNHGVVSGYSDNTFGGKESLEREQSAKVIWNAFESL